MGKGFRGLSGGDGLMGGGGVGKRGPDEGDGIKGGEGLEWEWGIWVTGEKG